MRGCRIARGMASNDGGVDHGLQEKGEAKLCLNQLLWANTGLNALKECRVNGGQ